MKKYLLILFAVILFIVSCVSTPASSDELDMAIREASDYLNNNIPRGSKIVILNIQSDSSALSEYIIEEMIANAVNDRNFTVVDRAQLDLIRQEQNFQLSGEVDDNTALAIGRFFGAQTIVSGRVSELDDRYRMSIRALNVQTAQVQGQYNRNIPAGRTITALIRNRSGVSVSNAVNNRQTQTAQQRGAENGTYTMWPRPRATQSGVPVERYIDRIVVSNDFIVFYFASRPQGVSYPPVLHWGGGHREGDYLVQDLDNPARFYSSVSMVSGGGGGTVVAVSFRRFPAIRFRFTTAQSDVVFEEIDLNRAEFVP